MITTALPDRSGVRLLLLSQSAGSGREADAKGEGVHDCIGCLLGAGSVLAGDDLAGPDCKGVPVAQAAHVDAIDLHRPHKPQEDPMLNITPSTHGDIPSMLLCCHRSSII